MKRTTAYYSLKTVKSLVVSKDNVVIEKGARLGAKRSFGWSREKIIEAIKKLQPRHFHKSDHRYDDPTLYVDYYKAQRLMRENVYIHFRIEDGILIICSFKEI